MSTPLECPEEIQDEAVRRFVRAAQDADPKHLIDVYFDCIEEVLGESNVDEVFKTLLGRDPAFAHYVWDHEPYIDHPYIMLLNYMSSYSEFRWALAALVGDREYCDGSTARVRVRVRPGGLSVLKWSVISSTVTDAPIV